MKVITNNSIEVQQVGKVSNCCGKYSSLSGDNSTDVRTFQVWVNMYHATQLSVDGIYGPLTKAAYSKWGSEWEKTQPKKLRQTTPGKPSNPNKKPIDPFVADGGALGLGGNTVLSAKEKADLIVQGAKLGLAANESTPENIAMAESQKNEKKSFKDKIIALPMAAKIGIGVGIAGILGFAIYKMLR